MPKISKRLEHVRARLAQPLGDACITFPNTWGPNNRPAVPWNGKNVYVYRVALEIVGRSWQPPLGNYVIHECDNGECWNPRHLEWSTQRKNMRDASTRSRVQRGVDRHNAKLTETDVREIRALALIHTQAELARRYGVTPSAISNIIARKCWAWLTD